MEKRSVYFIESTVKDIEKECKEKGFSTSWGFSDEGMCQELRKALKPKNIFLVSRTNGTFKLFPCGENKEEFKGVANFTPAVCYYYLTTKDPYWPDEKRKTPLKYGCVCMTYHGDGTISKGYSYCSLTDNFCKVKARGLAYHRLMQTLAERKDLYVGEYLGEGDAFMYVPTIYKGEFHTIPTEEELHTLGFDKEGKPLK